MGLDMMLYKEKKYEEEVAYWRKANMVHRYLCEHGVCIKEEVEYIIPYKVLRDLLNVCKQVKEKAVMKKGMIQNGETLENGVWVPIMIEGEYIENIEEIEALLPTQEGFFFGSTAYNQHYMEDIEDTIKQLEVILKDLHTEEDLEDLEDEYQIRYYASW